MAYFPTNVLDNQIKALPTIATASGSIATFTTDKAENLVDCEVQIVATGGGGTPTTPIAINGFSQAVVNLSEKNLFDKSKYMNLTTDYDYISSGGVQYKCKKIYLAKGLTVTVSQSASTTSSVVLLMHNVPQVNASGYFDLRTAGGSKTFTTSEEGCLYIGVYGSNDTDCNARLNECNVQIEKGNQATTYEAYNGNTYNIPFGQTIYGGSLDVITGKLTITHSKLSFAVNDMNNSEDYPGWKPSGVTSLIGANKNVVVSNGTTSVGTGFGVNTYTGQDVLFLPKNIYNLTQSQWQSQHADETIDFLIPLETPTTIQLDSEEVNAIVGTNNVYSDTGDISVQFILSVGEYVNQNT